MPIINYQVQQIRLNLDLIVRWIQQNWVLTVNHCNVNHRTKFTKLIKLQLIINGRLTFELKSGDIADTEMNRTDEIVGNKIASLDN